LEEDYDEDDKPNKKQQEDIENSPSIEFEENAEEKPS
jgi:hypothetical protein